MLKKVFSLMIVLLLSCLSNSLLAQSNVTIPTGDILKSDTTKVIIPISYIRLANAKLIQYNYLLKIKAQQDSIISLHKSAALEYNNTIKDFQGRIVNLTNDYNKVNNQLTKQKSITNFYRNTSIAGIVVILGLIILNR